MLTMECVFFSMASLNLDLVSAQNFSFGLSSVN